MQPAVNLQNIKQPMVEFIRDARSRREPSAAAGSVA
jgi:hypothetical protein